jgi:F-type H+-transporting ATPase subunit gamma
MPSTRDIRRRIKSVKNTAQITKAMQLVAAAKMKKAQDQATHGRPYAEMLNKVLVSLREGVEPGLHPFLAEGKGGKTLVVVIATDKGLCGALNTNLLREVAKFDPARTIFIALGRKGMQYLSRAGRTVLAEFELKETFGFIDSKAISKFAMEKFLSGEVDRVTVVFTDFLNTLTQIPRAKVILPISSLKVTAEVFGDSEKHIEITPGEAQTEYLFEPASGDVLGAVLPHHVHFQVYQMVLDARASEHSARMVAMKNATDNAKQLIKDLTLEYNKIRQASITTELLEITTAQMALGK